MNTPTLQPDQQQKPDPQQEPTLQQELAKSAAQDESERIQTFWTRTYFIVGGTTLIGGVFFSGLWLAGLVFLSYILDKVGDGVQQRKLEAIQRIADQIDARFPDAKITLQIPIAEAPRPLEMFVELPEKRFFLISVRAPGKGKVFYNEQREVICFQREGRSGVTRYKKPDLIEQAKENEHWIRKNRRDLFGGSSRDARRTAVRVLVFAQPTQLKSISEHLYDNVASLKVPYIRNSKGTIYILLEEQVCDFLANKPF